MLLTNTASALAAALFALVPLARALGTATIQNNCNFPIYAWSVSNVQGSMNTLASNGGTYEETYRVNPNGGGVSIKVAAAPSLAGPITQFEYTALSTLWFDISNVNGSPFKEQGLTVRAKPESSACRPITCDPGTTCGTQIYNEPDDDFAVSACTPDQDIIMIVCSGSSSGSDSGSGSESSSSAAPATTPAAAPIPASAAATPAAVTTSAAPNLLSWNNVQPPAAAAPSSAPGDVFLTVWTTAWVTTHLEHAVAPTAPPASTPSLRYTTIDSWVVDTTLSTAYVTAVQDVIDTITVPAAAPTA